MRGDGRIFRRGSRYWISYYVGGKELREPAGSSEVEARRKLKATRSAIAGDKFMTPTERKVTVGELLDNLITYLSNKGARSVKKVGSHLRAVRSFFGSIQAAGVTTPNIERYTAERLEAGKARATVNRELEALRQAFRLAARRTPPLIVRVPHVPLLKVENARQGFLSRADFDALLAKLEDSDVAAFIAWNYWTGMRPGETAKITWEMLDRESWTLRLAASAAKIGKGRVLALVGPLREIIDRRIRARRLDCPLIFHRASKGKVGQPVKDYRKVWASACVAVGLVAGRKAEGGVTPYDLRRTAIRNMVRGGVDPAIAMRVSGHRTRSTFDRYNIIDEADLRLAMEKTAAFVATQPTERKITSIEEHGQKTDNLKAARP